MDFYPRLSAIFATIALVLAWAPGSAFADDSEVTRRIEVGGSLLLGFVSGDSYEYQEAGPGFGGFIAFRLPPRFLRVRASLDYLNLDPDSFLFAFLGLEAGIPGRVVEPIAMGFLGANEHGLAGGGGLGIRLHLSKKVDAEVLLRAFAAKEVDVTIFGEPATDNAAVAVGCLGILFRP